MKSNETSHRALPTVLALPILIPNTAVIVERVGTGGEVVVLIPAVTVVALLPAVTVVALLPAVTVVALLPAVTVVILTTTVVAPIRVVAALGPDPKATRTHPTVARRTRCST